MTTHVASVDWSFADHPTPDSPNMHQLARHVIVGAAQGAVHTELAVTVIQPGGWLNRHFHSFEEALYVLAGELLFESDGHAHRLGPGDFALNPIATWHAIARPSGFPRC